MFSVSNDALLFIHAEALKIIRFPSTINKNDEMHRIVFFFFDFRVITLACVGGKKRIIHLASLQRSFVDCNGKSSVFGKIIN